MFTRQLPASLLITFLAFGCSPAEKIIQKRITVLTSVKSNPWTIMIGTVPVTAGNLMPFSSTRLPYSEPDAKRVSEQCLKDGSISSEDFDSLLEKGVKVISSSEWKLPSSNFRGTVDLYPFLDNEPDPAIGNGICLGQTYIIEGPEAVLNSADSLGEQSQE